MDDLKPHFCNNQATRKVPAKIPDEILNGSSCTVLLDISAVHAYGADRSDNIGS
jgi:hypothetical protein